MNRNRNIRQRLCTALLLLTAAVTATGCQTKTCRCYLLERWGSVRISEVYIDDAKTCGELGHEQMNLDDSTYRYCCDPDLPILDTIEIVRMFWDK